MSSDAAAAFFLSTVIVGLGATLFMDLWALVLNRAFGTPLANYCLVGRWFRHMPEGTFRHTNIAHSSQKHFECAVGWIACSLASAPCWYRFSSCNRRSDWA